MFTQTLSIMDTVEYFEILLPLALILICTKLFSLLGKKIGLPQVVGMLVAGILLGLIKLIPNQTIFTQDTLKGLSFLAKIGVVLIMFSAGIETDLKQFKSCGVGSLICKYSFKDSLRVGVGMMVRAEVVIVCTQKGIDNGLVNPAIMPFVLLLVVISALIAPLLLKLLYKGEAMPPTLPPIESDVAEQTAQAAQS